MDKKRAIELLIQAVDEIPHLKTLHYQNDEIKLWLDKVGNILRAGLKPEDYSKYWPVSQALEILKGIYEDNIYQEEYLRKITDYELALKSILLKYEVVGMEGKRDKGGEVEMKTLDEFNKFYEQILKYEDLVKEWKNTTKYSKETELKIQNSRTELQRWYPKLEKKISHYGEYSPTEFAGQKLDVFNIAFDSLDRSNVNGKLNAINEIKNILNKAIGRLEAQGETWGIETTPRPKRKSTRKRTLKKPITKKIYSEAKDIGTTIIAKFMAEKTK